jgi:pimeloyl-ACP methyl ester carboxylesterase
MGMIEDARGAMDYDESGSGPTIVLVPGSCSTGAAWRGVIAEFGGAFRCVTTSLPGYGASAERRPPDDPAIAHLAEALEEVVARADAPVHLVGHSFGGLVAVAVAMRGRASLASLTVLEAPAIELLREHGEAAYYGAFREMSSGYFAAFKCEDRSAIAHMVDFYGGPGTFASWPDRVRAYAMDTTAVNIRDWESAFAFPLRAALAEIRLPTFVGWSGNSHPAIQRANALLVEGISGAAFSPIPGAAHFMISTHPGETARLIASHVTRVASGG